MTANTSPENAQVSKLFENFAETLRAEADKIVLRHDKQEPSDKLKVGEALTVPGCVHVHFVEVHHHHNYGPIFDGCDLTQCTISGKGTDK